jgi:hypothetical protein
MSIKTVSISIGTMLLLLCLFYVFVFIYVVPNAAKISIPYSWRNIPMMQDSSVVNNYLGEAKMDTTNKQLEESWLKGIKNQKYKLTIQFSEASNLVVGYKIEYHFEKWYFKKDYLLEEKLISK